MTHVKPPSGFEPVRVPEKFVGGYLEQYRALLPRDLPEAYNLLLFAFAHITDDGHVAFSHRQPVRELKDDIRSRNTEGRPTLLSVGGAGGARVGLRTREQRHNFLDGITAVIDAYRFSGIDWDLEEGVPRGISADGVVAVSRALRRRYGDTFSLTLAPYGAGEIATTYQEIAVRLGDDLCHVGYQFYNGQRAPDVEQVLTITEEWLRCCEIDASRWTCGFVHVDDHLGLRTSHDRMAAIFEQVQTRHPTVRGVWTWGIADKDEPLGYPFATTMARLVDVRAVGPPARPPAEPVLGSRIGRQGITKVPGRDP